jgi:hypothetical protein
MKNKFRKRSEGVATQKVVMETRAASIGSLNEEARTFDVTFATNTPYTTWVQGERAIEILDCNAKSVDQARMKNGLPFLDNHSAYGSVKNILGRASNFQFDGMKGTCTIKVKEGADGDEILSLVRQKILTDISVGYRVFEYSVQRKEGQKPTYTAVKWQPMEVSGVMVPADPNANVRAELIEAPENKAGASPKTDSTQKKMEDTILTGAETPPAADQQTRAATTETPTAVTATPQAQQTAQTEVNELTRAAVEMATRAEMTRIASIRSIGSNAGMKPEDVENLISTGASLEQARAAGYNAMMARETTLRGAESSARGSEMETKTRAIESAILVRSGNGNEEDRQRGADYVRMSMIEMGREFFAANGVNTRSMSNTDVAAMMMTRNYAGAGAQTAGDFPILLQNIINKIMLDDYGVIEDTWSQFCDTMTLNDFRPHMLLRDTVLQNLRVVGDGADYPVLNVRDGKNDSIIAETYGGDIIISRKTIINDDVNVFQKTPRKAARAAARTLEHAVYSVLTSNPVLLSTGQPLFSAPHANIGTGSALGVAGLNADRTLLRRKKDNEEFLNLLPYLLLIPVELEGDALSLINSTTDPSQSNSGKSNPIYKMVQKVIATPQLTGTTRYIFANPMDAPVITVGFLNGNRNPYLEFFPAGANNDNITWKVRHDWGVAATDHVGVVRNAGA